LAAEAKADGDDARIGAMSPWSFDAKVHRDESYAALVGALRTLQDLIACGDPSPLGARRAHDLLEEAADLLDEFRQQPGRLNYRGDISGREDPLIVPVDLVTHDAESAEGIVCFTSFHHGGGGGVHGGSIALLFDDFIGRLSNSKGATRTAYLHVNYRAVCPIGQNLVVRGKITSRAGRKVYVSGTLTNNDVLVADCEGLWITLRNA
jgi:acyl-coenzyme A thioesterase PaaI-like protein